MSRVAKRFWNHKRIAIDDARKKLAAMGVMVIGPETKLIEPGRGKTDPPYNLSRLYPGTNVIKR